MIEQNTTPLDVIDEIYSLAYWMTGSNKDANNLLIRTYLNADKNSSEAELIKKFRICYFDSIGQVPVSGFMETLDQSMSSLTKSLWKWVDEIRLTVLLSEIPGLKHRDIGEINGNTVDTIRLWLSWGRKQLKNGTLLNYSPISKAARAFKKIASPPTAFAPIRN